MENFKYENFYKTLLLETDLNEIKQPTIMLYDGLVHKYQISKDKIYEPKIIDQINESIFNFINFFIDNPNFDKTNLKENLNKKLIIGVANFNINPDAGTTLFNENNNFIGIFADKNLVKNGVIYHELFHLASKGKPDSFKRGLKEGYTEALTHRYFSKNKKAYPNNVDYALKLEEIIGQELMEYAYSKGDISIITDYIGSENLDLFNLYNDKMDMLLGSYYRTNNNKALANEKDIIKKAINSLEGILIKLNENVTYKNKVK